MVRLLRAHPKFRAQLAVGCPPQLPRFLGPGLALVGAQQTGGEAGCFLENATPEPRASRKRARPKLQMKRASVPGLFFGSAVVFLLITALAKILSGLGHSRMLAVFDPVIG